MRRKSLDSLGAASSRRDWHVACPAATKSKEKEKIRLRKYDLKTAIASDAKPACCGLYPSFEESGVLQAAANLDTEQASVGLPKCVEEVDEDPVFRIKCDEEHERIRHRNYITEDEQKTLIKASMLLDTPSLAREIVRNHLQYKDEEHSAFLTYQFATLRSTIINQNNMCDDRLFLKAIEEVERCRKRLLLKAKKEIAPKDCGGMHNKVNEFFSEVLNNNTTNDQISPRGLHVSPLIVDELEKVKIKLPRIGDSPLMRRGNNYRINSDGRNATKLRFPRSNDDPVIARELLSSKLDEFKALFHDKAGSGNSSEGEPVGLRSNSSSLFESLENEKFKKLLDLDSNESVPQGNSQGSTPRSVNYMRLKAALYAGDQASSLIFDRIFTPKNKVQYL